MQMPYIELNHLTKDFGYGRGIFDVNLKIERGEVFGFVGTNGAGKTTTIRLLMGFLRAGSGSAVIDGLDCWRDAAELKKRIGYIPGEIAFPDAPTGSEFLRRQAELMGLQDMSYAERIIRLLQLDPTANLRRMSKGMKQKTAIVAAFMADPELLILDEPTTGLDPLMRSAFLSLLEEEKKKGKTIFMSSHMFEEVEQICDKVALIREGRIIDVKATAEIKHHEIKTYEIAFLSHADYQRFTEAKSFSITEKRDDRQQVVIQIHDREINPLMTTLTQYQLRSISEIKYTMESYFNSLYTGGHAHVKQADL